MRKRPKRGGFRGCCVQCELEQVIEQNLTPSIAAAHYYIPSRQRSEYEGVQIMTWPIGDTEESDAPLAMQEYTPPADLFNGSMQNLAEMRMLQEGWNGYTAPPPSLLAISTARRFLFAAHAGEISPQRVAPSVVGGVGITFRRIGRKCYVEFYNSGHVYLLRSNGTEPQVVPIRSDSTSFRAAVRDIQEYLT